MNKTIAIVEDERDIVDLITLHLERNGFRVLSYSDGASFLESLKGESPSLLLLDLMLPDMDGFEICKTLRRGEEGSSLPIIMLTARGEETDRVLGLELGADDYVTKPFSPRELVARVKAVLRRQEGNRERGSLSLRDGLLAIDTLRYKVLVEGRTVELTATEFKLLKLLVKKRGWVFPREKILDYLWGDEKTVFDRTVDVHIKHLREKLGPAGDLIKNVRGVGYKVEE